MLSDDYAEGFPPICGESPNTLILGSMPGKASLRQSQYYGHPQNRFWPIMQALIGVDVALDYDARCHALMQANLALWDVISRCERPGSLDSDIRNESIIINDIGSIVKQYPSIQKVVCNGQKAHQLLRKHCADVLNKPDITVVALPSTSPANAQWRLAALITAWQGIIP